VDPFGSNGKEGANSLCDSRYTRIPFGNCCRLFGRRRSISLLSDFFYFGGNNFCATQFGCVQDFHLQAVAFRHSVMALRI